MASCAVGWRKSQVIKGLGNTPARAAGAGRAVMKVKEIVEKVCDADLAAAAARASSDEQ